MCLAPRYMNTSRWVPVLFFRNAASSSATPCAMAVVAVSNSATKASGTRHLWLASSSRRVGEWKGMHVSGTGLGSASGADIAAAFSHRLIVSRGITLQFARRIDPDAAGDTTPAPLAGSADRKHT